MINWRDINQQLSRIGMDGIDIEWLLSDNKTSKFDLTLLVTDAGDEFVLDIEYSTDLFNHDSIDRLTGHLQTLLEGVADNSGQRIEVLPLLNSVERKSLLTGFNRTRVESAEQNKCVHELFDAQAKRTPGAVAAVYEDEALTYRELDEKANAVASRLRKWA